MEVKCINNSNRIKMLIPFLLLLLFASILRIEAVGDVQNAGTIVGEVVSVNGPVPDQTISLKRHEGGLFSEVASTVTDREGKYKFEDLPVNASFILELRYNGTRHFRALTTASTIVRADFNLIGTLTVRVVRVDHTTVEGLLIYLESLPGVVLANTTTDRNGVGIFNHLDLNELYRVSFTFYGVPYYENVRSRDRPSTQVNFTIYETTMDDEDIKINLHHVFVRLEGEYLSVSENIVYENAGIRVFNNSWLRAWLPEDRFDFVTSIMDCCLKQFEDGILFDPMDPIKPGSRFQVWMEYKIRVSSSDFVFKKKVDYDTDSFQLFLEDTTGVDVRSVTGLTSKGTVTIDGTNYNLLTSSDLEAGTYVRVKLSRLTSSEELLSKIMFGAILLAVPTGYFLVSILTKNWKNRKKPSVEDMEAEKLALFRKIAKLESEYDAGNISKEEYEKTKSKYKRRAIHVMRQIDGFRPVQIETSVPSSRLLSDLYAKEQALTSTLEKLKADFQRGLVSKEGYERVKARFEDRRIAVREKIKELEKLEGSKSGRKGHG